MGTLNAHTYASRDDAVYHYLQRIDVAAAQARRIDPAQESVYQQKLTEARQYGGPLLQREADATGVDIDAVCTAVLRERQRWEQHVHQVEILRITAKAAVRSAHTTADMHHIYHEFEGSL